MLITHNLAQTTEFNVAAITAAPLRLAKAIRLRAVPPTIFELVSDHNRLPELFPWVQCVTIAPGPTTGPGTRRRCNFGGGLVLEEVIVGWEPPRMLAYVGVEETHPFGMKGHLGLITCLTAGETQTVLTWRHYFNHPNPGAMQQKLDGSLSLALQKLIDRFGGELLESYSNYM